MKPESEPYPAVPAYGGGDSRRERNPGVFVSTQWSMVMRAGGESNEVSAAALERLCQQYWQPLYYFVRRRGYSEHDAQDLTQGFFARLLDKRLLGAADRERGRFRTFLLTALENFLVNEWDKANRLKRGGGHEFVSVEAEAGYRLLPLDTLTPERAFERRWVQTVIETVLRRLRSEFDLRGGPGRFDVLKQYLFGDRGEVPYGEAAARLGISESAVKSAIHRLRCRYGELFADEIAQTVARPEDIDPEIQHLLAVLEGS